MYNKDNQIRSKTSMLKSRLNDYVDAYILVKGIRTVAKETDAAPNNANKKVIFKNYTLFTSYASYAIYKQNKQSTSRWCLICWYSNANV